MGPSQDQIHDLWICSQTRIVTDCATLPGKALFEEEQLNPLSLYNILFGEIHSILYNGRRHYFDIIFIANSMKLINKNAKCCILSEAVWFTKIKKSLGIKIHLAWKF